MSNTLCNEIRLLLPDWILDKERDEQHQKIFQHLSQCNICKQESNEFQQLLLQMKPEHQSASTQQYFINLLPRIHQRIERKNKQKIYWRIAQTITPLAAIILVLVFGPWFKTNVSSFDEKLQSITRNISEGDLQDFASLDFNEEYLPPAQQEEAIFDEDDSELLQTLFEEQPTSLFPVSSVIESDENISLETLSDEDAQTIVSDLEKRFSTNKYLRK